ncbi:hypothetical protein TVAG_379820 [Trichomonas vaginalis G3]|uniref:Uncharacterized protein n=1 Tax=Trichomonas vaginalis (strain ATCC PRA-98 / G3) TaxID=412133 RepID=A2E7K7_TRIV3|nr:hypothetical protein TVAGG3_0340120 [Trichomonas vaginalis G3]EAY11400.1 hypothetical protein TVAG_379820 [Trichomonas vaginalis G3]KAI5530579.1 hypothetical protein TVAGG3_0340120 [Trichomonas vaginalis G3]|eukprot:XP_001323623.1 hypothetical protein [Trichomonas vaginalis G3]
MSNFEKTHQYYSQAIVALANPYSVIFSDVRNSSVENIKLLKEAADKNQLELLKKTSNTVNSIKTMLALIKESHDQLTKSRNAIQNMLNKSHSQTIEQHAAAIFQESDDSEEKSGENDWSDEVIIT